MSKRVGARGAPAPDAAWGADPIDDAPLKAATGLK